MDSFEPAFFVVSAVGMMIAAIACIFGRSIRRHETGGTMPEQSVSGLAGLVMRDE